MEDPGSILHFSTQTEKTVLKAEEKGPATDAPSVVPSLINSSSFNKTEE